MEYLSSLYCNSESSGLIKSNGGLFKPSSDAVVLCEIAEKVFRNNLTLLQNKNVLLRLQVEVLPSLKKSTIS